MVCGDRARLTTHLRPVAPKDELPADWPSNRYKEIVNADGIPSEEIVDRGRAPGLGTGQAGRAGAAGRHGRGPTRPRPPGPVRDPTRDEDQSDPRGPHRQAEPPGGSQAAFRAAGTSLEDVVAAQVESPAQFANGAENRSLQPRLYASSWSGGGAAPSTTMGLASSTVPPATAPGRGCQRGHRRRRLRPLPGERPQDPTSASSRRRGRGRGHQHRDVSWSDAPSTTDDNGTRRLERPDPDGKVLTRSPDRRRRR